MFRRAFLAVQGNGQPILTPEELEVAQAAYVAAQNAANPGQPIDPNYGIAGNDAKLKEVLITFERALDVFKISNNARSKFLKNYETWAPLCKENIRVLRNLAEELLKERHERNKDRAIGGAIGGTARQNVPNVNMSVHHDYNNTMDSCDDLTVSQEQTVLNEESQYPEEQGIISNSYQYKSATSLSPTDERSPSSVRQRVQDNNSMPYALDRTKSSQLKSNIMASASSGVFESEGGKFALEATGVDATIPPGTTLEEEIDSAVFTAFKYGWASIKDKLSSCIDSGGAKGAAVTAGVAVAGVITGVLTPTTIIDFAKIAKNKIFSQDTCEEFKIVKLKLQNTIDRIKIEEKIFSDMAQWFYCPEGLHKTIFSLINYSTFTKISQEIKKFEKESADIQGVELTNEFNRVLKFCMKEMAKDKNMIKKYGEELAPAVMTFVFVVCLMQDHNRTVLDCSLVTARLATDLLIGLNLGSLGLDFPGNLAGGSAGGDNAAYAGQALYARYKAFVDFLISTVSLIEMNKWPDTAHVEKMKDAADEFEKILFYIKSVYHATEDSDDALSEKGPNNFF